VLPPPSFHSFAKKLATENVVETLEKPQHSRYSVRPIFLSLSIHSIRRGEKTEQNGSKHFQNWICSSFPHEYNLYLLLFQNIWSASVFTSSVCPALRWVTRYQHTLLLFALTSRLISLLASDRVSWRRFWTLYNAAVISPFRMQTTRTTSTNNQSGNNVNSFPKLPWARAGRVWDADCLGHYCNGGAEIDTGFWLARGRVGWRGGLQNWATSSQRSGGEKEQ
jgi:hypothetical protein